MSRQPLTKWAQRLDKIFITIELPDAKGVKLTLQSGGHLHFSATTGPDNLLYEIDLDLYDQVNVDESRASMGLRNIIYVVKKADEKWWSRLLRQEGKPPLFLKADWDKWIEEDEESAYNSEDFDFGTSDLTKLNLSSAENVKEESEAEDEIEDTGPGWEYRTVNRGLRKLVQKMRDFYEYGDAERESTYQDEGDETGMFENCANPTCCRGVGATFNPNDPKEAAQDNNLNYILTIAKERGATEEEVNELIWKLTEYKKSTSTVKNGQDIIDLQPEQVEFEVEFDTVSLSSIELTNKSDEIIKFEFNMKAYRMDKYRIFPYFGVLQPRATVLVRVGREPVTCHEHRPVRHIFAAWKMLSSEDRLPLEITKGGEVVQTISIRVFTPQPPGYAQCLQEVDNPPREFWQQIVYRV